MKSLKIRISQWTLFERILAGFTAAGLLLSISIMIIRLLSMPCSVWNGARLAWLLSLRYGYHLYNIDSGPIFAAIYGPVASFFFLPVALVSSITAAVISASIINMCFFFLPLVWLCVSKCPVDTKGLLFAAYSFVCFSLLTFQSTTLKITASMVHVDATSMGLSLMACTFIIGRKKFGTKSFLLASVFSVLAVWAKQTVAPVWLAIPIYIIVTEGFDSAKRYIGFFLGSLVLISAVLCWIFGLDNLYFFMVTIPIRQQWGPSVSYCGQKLVREMTPIGCILIANSVFQWMRLPKQESVAHKIKVWSTANPWVLLLLASVLLVPTSLLGMLKVGGGSNTLSPTVYFLMASFALAVMEFNLILSAGRGRLWSHIGKLIPIILVIWLMSVNVGYLSSFRESIGCLESNELEQGYRFAKKHPGQVYFPTQPLSCLMAEGKFYHHSCGLFDRKRSRFPVSDARFRADLPEDLKYVAFKSCVNQARLATQRLPEFHKKIIIPELPGWHVYVRDDFDEPYQKPE